MKAAVYGQPGGPEVFRYEDVPDPQPSADDVLVQVEAISIEGGDTLHRARDQVTNGRHIVGYQAAGTVLAVGGQVTRFQPGERVVTVGMDGSHAELRAVPESFCWPIPPGLSTDEAACVPVAFGTARDALFEFGRLQPGETVLIHAGAGGVGIAAIQLAKRAGARVLATASSDEKLARLAELGLDHGINYRTAGFPAEVRRLTSSRYIIPVRLGFRMPAPGIAWSRGVQKVRSGDVPTVIATLHRLLISGLRAGRMAVRV